ncbi:COP9 signalosome complex subunit 4-like isoform X2 [Glossina fuscipes]|uniref:COP9 signalosome complex subunit 4-like isoform X2 n=1 Tax=Glossina fuscipes TaxID=7396 RepID=A0A9C6DXQ8_9MUSC|nr:COP9 signalosome complex subunit 4-like isoform X2 [Glossina fuscipes]
MVIIVNSLRGQLMSLVNFSGTHKEQADRHRQLLEVVLTNSGVELVDMLKLFVEAIVNEHVSLVISRQILNDWKRFSHVL